MTAAVDEGFERYEFAQGVQKLQAFFWDEFCDWYLELAKLPLAEGGASRERAQRVLATVQGAILRLLHPVVPFVTEELWDRLGGEGRLITARWPVQDAAAVDEAADAAMAAVIEIVSAIRRFRSEHKVAPSKKIAVLVVPAEAKQEAALGASGGPDPRPGQPRPVRARGRAGSATEGAAAGGGRRHDRDPARGRGRHRRRRGRHRPPDREARRRAGQGRDKLANKAFVSKAPDHVVDSMRARRQPPKRRWPPCGRSGNSWPEDPTAGEG